MVKFKLVIGEKSGKTKQLEADETASKQLIGKKIGDTFKGELIDFAGYEFEITGGSDSAGFPMRKDVAVSGRRKVLVVNGIGLKNNPDKVRRRRTVSGSVIGAHIAQINTKVVKAGQKPLFEQTTTEQKA
jgi:small subunit ribosomal protein S6e